MCLMEEQPLLYENGGEDSSGNNEDDDSCGRAPSSTIDENGGVHKVHFTAAGSGLGSEGLENKRLKRLMGVAYMFAMGMCGVVLVALGASLQELAENTGRESTHIGSVFMVRGGGAIIGAICSASLYHSHPGNKIMAYFLLIMGLLLIWLPFQRSSTLLHINFGVLGLCTAVVDTGCQIMTRRVHGQTAGPWLGANTVAFGLSGAFEPLISYLTANIVIHFAITAGLSVFIAIFLLFLPNPETCKGYIKKTKNVTLWRDNNRRRAAQRGRYCAMMAAFASYYHMEFAIGFIVFWVIGGKVGVTAYLTQYVDDTQVLPEPDASLLLTVLWLSISLGRLVGIQMQRKMTLGKLYAQSVLLYAFGAIAFMFVAIFPHSRIALWMGVSLYGASNGPLVGYSYDLNNRLTLPSETGMSIVMIGLTCGASFVPFFISTIWRRTGMPLTLSIAAILSHVMPLPALLACRKWQRQSAKRATE